MSASFDKNTYFSLDGVKALSASFNTEIFGEGLGDLFKSPFAPPPVYPTKGKHPRVMVSSHNAETIKANLTKPQNASAYAAYQSYTEHEMSGEYSGSTFELLTRIEAKAFRYAMTGEMLYG